MKKEYKITFYKSELAQYKFILSDNEIKEKVSYFILEYVSIESFYKKLLVAKKESNGKKLTQNEKKNLRIKTTEVISVLDFFNIDCDTDLVDRIFGNSDNNYMECSIKKLRDRFVHRVNKNVLEVILERYDDMMKDMENFLDCFK